MQNNDLPWLEWLEELLQLTLNDLHHPPSTAVITDR